MLYSLGISALCSQEPIRHLHQYTCANANKLRCMASYIGTGNNLGEFARELEVNMGFLYPIPMSVKIVGYLNHIFTTFPIHELGWST